MVSSSQIFSSRASASVSLTHSFSLRPAASSSEDVSRALVSSREEVRERSSARRDWEREGGRELEGARQGGKGEGGRSR